MTCRKKTISYFWRLRIRKVFIGLAAAVTFSLGLLMVCTEKSITLSFRNVGPENLISLFRNLVLDFWFEQDPLLDYIPASKWTEYTRLNATEKLNLLVREKASMKDPRLIDLIRKYIQPPSDKPYALKNPDLTDYSCGQSTYINNLLLNSKLRLNSASDMSRTIERKQDEQWVLDHNFDQKPYYEVPCFPLYSIMLAMKQTSIDYFGLDVEGNELPILQTIPFDDLNITSVTTECLEMYARGRQDAMAVKTFLENKGYMCHGIIAANPGHGCFAEDFVFLKKGLVSEQYSCNLVLDPFRSLPANRAVPYQEAQKIPISA
ncbi:hypothetical protein ACJMK2_038281 [Sinanodonta woodiana]|uniref:Methyltransferase FkbM domain-containing protein n=1 Tax=Sinanodonta woodiana TaxID=1069815 RepID=A0ABD3W8I0_SINWO